ncbi:hypothetical protein QC763_610200 [Podospora pseudopauciseta]|uniref:Alpha-mannosyltransferase alg11p n=1 Tax=Podospora pseudopauciseta TaxID=2093780 RepID=A0ABR0H6H1_9PEZI|nr:hypothetical protein QC763_610200 [Podospora pseudopauciseta]
MVSNARPLVILASYMVTAVALTVRCIGIVRRHPVQKAKRSAGSLVLFGALAVVSLATTWSYMFGYFRWSYFDWAANAPSATADDQLHLGEWLRDTSLFKQAWFSALETSGRAWWTLQIFGFCAIWSVMLSVQAKKRNIPQIWAFMLLGQIVAISFASNLFFLAVLAHDVKDEKKPAQSKQKPSSRTSDILILVVNLAVTLFLFGNLDSPYFLSLLLAPHVLAFVPLLRDGISSGSTESSQLREPSKVLQFGILAAVLAAGTSQPIASGETWKSILDTLYEHPAVSSVGWDVICCWVSYTVWFLVRDSE